MQRREADWLTLWDTRNKRHLRGLLGVLCRAAPQSVLLRNGQSILSNNATFIFNQSVVHWSWCNVHSGGERHAACLPKLQLHHWWTLLTSDWFNFTFVSKIILLVWISNVLPNLSMLGVQGHWVALHSGNVQKYSRPGGSHSYYTLGRWFFRPFPGTINTTLHRVSDLFPPLLAAKRLYFCNLD